MHILKNEGLDRVLHELELLSEQEVRVSETVRRKELEIVSNRFEERFIQVKKSYALTYIAFHAKIPMDRVGDMIVAKSGVYMKGASNVGPVPINSRDGKSAARGEGETGPSAA